MGTLTNKFGSLAKVLCPSADKENDEPDQLKQWTPEKKLPVSSTKRDIYLKANPVTLTVNGQTVQVDTTNVSTETSLARFLRSDLNLTGTKISCGQAGCGACVVTATFIDPATGGQKTRSINSCITPLLKCDGWSITTIEGLGNKTDGLHPIQNTLAAFHGTQCGFCSPGMVMVMDGLLENKPSPSLEDIETLLDGNICRCTGYRPIFDAFKSMTPNPPPDVLKKLHDIEDLVSQEGAKFTCPKTKKPCAGLCSTSSKDSLQFIKTSDGEWLKPTTLEDLMGLLDNIGSGVKYRLVAGNTGTGIYNNDGPYDQYIDITSIPELTSISTTPFNVGAGVALNDFINVLESQALADPIGYKYGMQMASHIKIVANTNVRNVGTIGGNLMLKHDHPEFPSDIFMLLETIGATLVVRNTVGGNESYSPLQFLSTSMDKKLLLFIQMPTLTSKDHFMSYKITPRSQNAHAYVNAAFLINTENLGDTFIVNSQPNIVYGGINESFVHAMNTEIFLIARDLNDANTLRGAMDLLDQEAIPDNDPVLASPEYRSHLVKALFYKFVISVLGSSANSALQSAATQIERGISKGKQEYFTDESEYPLTKPIMKLEGQIQCSGEAEYIDDIPPVPTELYAAYVTSTVGNCELASVDPSVALAMPGVVSYVDHRDIPGMNTVDGFSEAEPLFTSNRIEYAGQAIGLIVADTYEHARKAAKAVEVTYANRETPVLTIKDAIGGGEKFKRIKKIPPVKMESKKKSISDGKQLRLVQGELEIGSQYHFHMETQSCIVRPIEEGEFDVFSATQYMMGVQQTISKALNVPDNKINIKVRRLGGAYGGKIFKPSYVAAACAVAANKLRLPVRLILDLQTNMELMGKRVPYYFQYEASIDASNKIQSLSYNVYTDGGAFGTMDESLYIAYLVQSCYNSQSWTINPANVLTNTPTPTFVRAPTTAQGLAITETVLEHIGLNAGLDPLEFRMNNFLAPGDSLLDGTTFQGTNPLPDMIAQLKISSNYDQRVLDVAAFNQANAWKKRGLALTPMRWQHLFDGSDRFTCQIAIHQYSGNVAISIGGIEMGQGINTKVVQVVAKELGVEVELISVKPANNFIGVNNSITGGSKGSDLACSAASIVTKSLRAKIKAVEDTMTNPTWPELINECFNRGIDLNERHTTYTIGDNTRGYDIWGAAAIEVEVDVLTGEKTVRRVDIIEDTGASISPEIDVGQVEGAFVMALGLWTSEEIKYDPNTGRLLTRDTWEYKPPASRDIPEEFNVTLYNRGDSNLGILGSKATGEPPFLMGVSFMFALRQALNAVKEDLGVDTSVWYQIDGPATHERIQRVSGVTSDDFFL